MRKLRSAVFVSLTHSCVEPGVKPRHLSPVPLVWRDFRSLPVNSCVPGEGQVGTSKPEMHGT